MLNRFRNWLARNWLILVMPPICFLLAAGIMRQLRSAWQGAKYAKWQEDYSAAREAGMRGEREQSLRRLMEAAAAAPDNPEVHSELAMGFQQLGQESYALTHLEKALHFQPGNPDNPDDYLSLVRAQIYRGNYAEAERILREEVLPRWPDASPVHYYQGIIALESGKGKEATETALEHFKHCLQQSPDDPRPLYQMGVGQLRLNRLEEAVATFRKVLEARPMYSSAYHDLSTALRRLGKDQEAGRMLEKFQELESRERRIDHLETQFAVDKLASAELRELAQLYLDLRRFEPARNTWMRYTREQPTDPEGYEGLAEACRALKKEQEALRAEKLAEALSSRSTPLH